MQLRRGKGKGGAKGFKQQQDSAAAAAASSSAAGPKVIAPIRDQVYGGGPLTDLQRAENTVVSVLAVLFFVILAEGVFLAGSVRSRLAGLHERCCCWHYSWHRACRHGVLPVLPHVPPANTPALPSSLPLCLCRASCPPRPTSLPKTSSSPPSPPPSASSSSSPPPTVSGRRAARPRRASEGERTSDWQQQAAASGGGSAASRPRPLWSACLSWHRFHGLIRLAAL